MRTCHILNPTRCFVKIKNNLKNVISLLKIPSSPFYFFFFTTLGAHIVFLSPTLDWHHLKWFKSAAWAHIYVCIYMGYFVSESCGNQNPILACNILLKRTDLNCFIELDVLQSRTDRTEKNTHSSRLTITSTFCCGSWNPKTVNLRSTERGR